MHQAVLTNYSGSCQAVVKQCFQAVGRQLSGNHHSSKSFQADIKSQDVIGHEYVKFAWQEKEQR